MTTDKHKTFHLVHHKGDEPHLLREIFRTYQLLISNFSHSMGMPASRFTLMRLLAFSEDDLGVMDLARQLGVNAAAVTRQVQELEREQLITRQADNKDGRRSYIRLSPKGYKQFEQIHERTHQLERSLSSAIGMEKMASAAATLSDLRSFLERIR